ncbi:venom protease-like [Oratosquilla oratoria]|uniref:venom protease-like n=1 Tax=Oratosquilla oratoria TaxID=337810 RepID=UPI003F762D7E
MEAKRGVTAAGVLLVLAIFVIPSKGQGLVFEGSGRKPVENCRTRTHQNGWCREISKCPPVLANAHLNTHTVCGYRGSQQVVCCPVSVGLLETSSPSTTFLGVSAPQVSFECGARKRSTRGFEKRFVVVGGFPAEFGNWPWTALIGVEDRRGINWICNGVLINQEWVLTAAHCFITSSSHSYVVRLGELDYDLTNDTTWPPIDFRTSRVVLHPNYNHPVVYNDLALVHLGRPVTFSAAIQPACLPWGNEIHRDLTGASVTLAGWGATFFNGPGSNELMEVDLFVLGSEDCARNYETLFDYSQKFPRGFVEGTLCVGTAQGGKDACEGDSGGALVYRNSQNRFTVAGTVATGYGCGSAEYPGVYISMHNTAILTWIKKVAFSGF